MFRSIQPTVWAFDCEWAPDAAAGRRLLDLPPDLPESDVFEAMWTAAGATADRPRPYLKTAWCRLVSIAVVERRVDDLGNVHVHLCSVPKTDEDSEQMLLNAFFGGLARRRPQLVGYNSQGADLKVLLQRGVIHGLAAPGLCERPARPWEGPDYFYPHSDWHIDLMRLLGGRGATCPTLADMAVLAGLPAKGEAGTGVSGGHDVADLWLRREVIAIRHYNEIDALLTYLLWLRTAHFGGHFSASDYACEEGYVERLLEQGSDAGAEHLQAFLERWRACSA
ncbi:MAG: hypothetical protein AAGI71_14765 [Bacteroidota bacterium]